MKISIRWTLILGILGLIWGTYLITTTSTYVSSERVLNEHAKNIMSNIAELAMEQSQNHLANAHGAAALTRRLLAANVVSSDDANIDALEHYFLDQLAIYPHFAGLYLGKPNGDFYYVSRNEARSPDGFRTKIIRHQKGARRVRLIWRDKDLEVIGDEIDPADPYDPRQRPWYKLAAREKRIVWTDPYIFYTSQKPGITIAGPTFDKRGGLRSVVGVDIEIDELSVFIASLQIGRNGRAFMINNNGDVVAFPDLSKISAKGKGTEAPRLVKINELDDVLSRKAFDALNLQRGPNQRFILTRSEFARFRHDGQFYHAMLTPFSIQQWPWIIGVHLPEDDYLGVLKQHRRANILLTLAISAFATLIGLLFARSIVRPVANLEKEALAVRNGDMQSRFDIQSRYQELQETASAFIRMKDAIQTSQQKYQGIFENIQDVYYESTLDGQLLEISPSVEKITGYAREELIGKDIQGMYADPQDRRRMVETLQAEGRITDYEICLQGSDGRHYHFSLNSVLLHDKDRDAPKIVGSMRDINDRKMMEAQRRRYQEELEEQVQQRTAALSEANQKLISEMKQRQVTEAALGANEEKYRNILQSISEGYFETDLNGNFTFINDATADILGRPHGHIIGTNIKKFIHSHAVKPLFRSFSDLYQDGATPRIIELQIIRVDGQTRGIELSASLIRDADQTPRGFRGIGRDVSNRLAAERERKQLENRLQRLQRLEAIGTLAGGIAHDFNNLLMGMQANTALLLLEIDIGGSQYEKVKNIEQCIKSGADLTRQLLGYARGGKYVVKPTNINQVVRKTAQLFERTRKEIRINGDYQADIWTVDADQGQIEQVLVNLYLNAYQAMNEGGDIMIQTENIVLDRRTTTPYGIPEGRYVKISIRDSGTGIEPAIQDRIFEPFFTTKEMGRGTGLGLASAYGIIKNHGGFIDFDSRIGAGTSFYIYIPVSDDAARPEDLKPQALHKGAETILLVDDEPYILKGCRPMLEKMGYSVVVANSGKKAVEIHREARDRIDLVILDMIMPDMDGGKVFDHIKRDNPKTPVILSSGYSMEGLAEEILEKGCEGFIQKPYDLPTLSQKIRDILDSAADQ